MQNLDHLSPHADSKNQDHNLTVEQPLKTDSFQSISNTTKTSSSKKRHLKWIGLVLGLVLLALGSVGSYSYLVTKQLKNQSETLKLSLLQAKDAFKAQDLIKTKAALDESQTKLGELESSYGKLKFLSLVPFVANYYKDGQEAIDAAQAGLAAGQKAVDALVPYADVLGFKGEGSFGGGTVEDRISSLLGTIDKLLPQLDAIGADLETANEHLARINPDRYPETVKGVVIKNRLIQAQKTLDGASQALSTYRPAIERLPSIAGAEGERKKYLILFQNDNELRPTGGFLTAYAVVNVENGKVTAEKSDDIYELDKKFRKKIPIPKELGRYLTTEKYWHLRDMNIYPDFKESMDVFYSNYSTVPGEPDNIDGIIAIDTKFVVHLMEILGPVEVPGYGTFSAEIDKSCDCPQIIHVLSEIITRPTPYIRENRKGILGPLMQSLIVKSYSAPKNLWPQLFESFFADVGARHVQFYFLNQADQQAAEAINAAGRMSAPKQDQDFLAVVDANLAGAKSNLYVKNEWYQEVTPPVDGYLTKTIEVTYKNPRRADNCNLEAGLLCLNSTLKDWSRIYLPKGSQLVKAQGFLEEPKVYETNGFTVVDGYFVLQPKGVAKLKLEVKVPYKDRETYRLYVWKQGGLNEYPFVVKVDGSEEELKINKDIQYETQF